MGWRSLNCDPGSSSGQAFVIWMMGWGWRLGGLIGELSEPGIFGTEGMGWDWGVVVWMQSRETVQRLLNTFHWL